MMKLKEIITNLIFVASLCCLMGCTPSREKIRLELLDSIAEYKAIYKEYSENPTEHNEKRLVKQISKVEKFSAKYKELDNAEKEKKDNSEESKEDESSKKEEKLPKTYEEWLEKAKEYESQKKWCFALGAYYDAMGMDIPSENKIEAYNGFVALEGAICEGNPGLGTFNEFTLHDEWKNLLVDTKDYLSVVFPYEVTVGELSRGDLDYTTQTATYSAPVEYKKSNRYFTVFELIKRGYEKAYKSDWIDLPEPKEYLKTLGSYIVKFNIVDDEYNEVFPSVDWTLSEDEKIVFTGISPNVMDLIDNKKVFAAPYGIVYNSKLQDHTAVFMYKKNKEDKRHSRISNLLFHIYKDKSMIHILGQNFEMSKTEVTQGFYESIMGENPSKFKGANNPVECVSWYDAIYFCNKLSVAKGYEPVYSVNGNTDITKWNYTPHQENSIKGGITQNISANGYRLPTVEEWAYAAKGGQDYTYVGSNEIDEVAWYSENSNAKTHPVAQKKSNGYGLCDMSGNVWEWCWDSVYSSRYYCGGSWRDSGRYCEVGFGNSVYSYARGYDLGFRIIRSVK